MRYAVGYGLLVPDFVFNAVRELELDIYERYGGNHGLRQPPHITVKAPFATADLDAHERYLDALARRTDRFEVQLEGIAFFEEPDAVAFVDVMANARLTELTAAILRELAPEATPSPYEASDSVHYHLTLAFLEAGMLARAKRDYAAVTPRFAFTADRLGLFVGLGGADWVVARVASLR
jgi:2'-5' RNA ligase